MATALFGSSSTATRGDTPYDFSVKDIDGKEVDLAKYRGKVILVVNVASQCGELSCRVFLLSSLVSAQSRPHHIAGSRLQA